MKSSAVSARCTNNAIWNNGTNSSSAGGVTVKFNNLPTGMPGGLCLLPVTHCTIINNGTSNGWSVEVDEGLTTGGTFLYANQPFDATTLRTEIVNSILMRDYATPFGINDFGPRLESAWAKFDDNSAPVLSTEVGVSGLRAFSGIFIPLTAGTPGWTSAAHPFAGAPNLSLWDLTQFRLWVSSPSINFYRDHTPNYMNVFSPESGADFESDSRPAVSTTNRDKGYDEIP